jgi:hypothetical protein
MEMNQAGCSLSSNTAKGTVRQASLKESQSSAFGMTLTVRTAPAANLIDRSF